MHGGMLFWYTLGLQLQAAIENMCTLHGYLWKCLSLMQVLHTCILRKTSFSMQLCQLLPGRLCYLILVPLRASTQALCFIWTMNTSKQTNMRWVLSLLLPVNSNMPAVVKVCLACASACYISHQCACSIMICCCICMTAVHWRLAEDAQHRHGNSKSQPLLCECPGCTTRSNRQGWARHVVASSRHQCCCC